MPLRSRWRLCRLRMRRAPCGYGKNQDGTWKCRYWGEEQESKAAERQETAHARMEASVRGQYIQESIDRFKSKRKNGHLDRKR